MKEWVVYSIWPKGGGEMELRTNPGGELVGLVEKLEIQDCPGSYRPTLTLAIRSIDKNGITKVTCHRFTEGP